VEPIAYFLGISDKNWVWLATVVYGLTFVMGTYSALKLRRKTRLPYILGLVSVGWILQTIGLYARGLEYGACPLSNKYELVQFLVWSLVAIYIFVGAPFRVSLLGVFCSGFATALSTMSTMLPEWDSQHRTPVFGDSPWIEAHAALALMSYGVFAVLTLTSTMYLLQMRSLKQKKVIGNLFPFLPSIVELASINRRLLIMGFAVLSFSLGIGYKYFVQDSESVITLKLSSTIAVWLAYGLLIALRVKYTMSPRRSAWIAIWIFAAALLSLAAVNMNQFSPADIQTQSAAKQLPLLSQAS